MDGAITSNDKDFNAEDFQIIYDLEIFKPKSQEVQGEKSQDVQGEMSQYKDITSANENDLLGHPLSEVFLQLKYWLFRPFFVGNLFLVLVFTICLSVLSCLPCPILPWANIQTYKMCQHEVTPYVSKELTEYLNKVDVRDHIRNCSELRALTHLCFGPKYNNLTFTKDTNTCTNVTSNINSYEWLNCDVFLSFYGLTWLFVLPLTVFKLISMFKRQNHFRLCEDAFELGMNFVSIAYLLTLYFGPTKLVDDIIVKPTMFMWFMKLEAHFGAIALLLSWIELTLLLGRFPAIGVYVQMSLYVTRLLISLLLFYATTLVGFSLAFHVLLPDHQSFDNPVTSGLKVKCKILFKKDKM